MVSKPKELFSHEQIDFDTLKKNAYNYRWAEVREGVIPLTAADSDFPSAQGDPGWIEGIYQQGILFLCA